ncbi:MAG: hypothetical protein HOI15_05145 [Opitutales bacterium]|nr:hypothetical protein [Opitutales bacterium]MBT6381649.1 hypothetical protein [Opitutales bacterium]
MKTFIVILSVTLFLLPSLFSIENEVDPAYEYNLTGDGVDLQFKVIKEPIFPISLRNRGLTWGHVTIHVDIDYSGELRDWLVTQASHKDFAKEVESVIGQWKFAPPMWKGKPISIIGAIDINFRSQGDVVSLNISSGIADVIMKYSNPSPIDRIEIVEFDQLDTYPELIKTVKPLVPKRLNAKHRNTVGIFTFYIDTEGYVRLPHIDRIEGKIDIRLLEAAQDALEQWRFNPPTSKGRKVIVAVSQPFVFGENGS